MAAYIAVLPPDVRGARPVGGKNSPGGGGSTGGPTDLILV